MKSKALKFLLKLSLCLVLCAITAWAVNYYVYQGDIAMDIAAKAVEQTKNSNEAALIVRQQQSAVNMSNMFPVGLIWLAIFVFVFIEDIITLFKKGKEKMKMKNCIWIFVVGLFISMFIGGCKKYNEPKYEDINSNETAFVIKLEGESKQSQFSSIDFLKERQVAAKRIEIPRTWRSTAWNSTWYSGEYMDMVRVIKVDRTPVTVEWTASAETGTSNKNQGIWVESDDSVGFSTGFSCSAYVSEEDAATFLYFYPEKSLKNILDSEVRAAFQGIVAEVSARYKMDILRNRKQELIDSVRYGIKDSEVVEIVLNSEGKEEKVKRVLKAPSKEVNEKGEEIFNPSSEGVIRFFKRRGITVTTTSMFGGFSYENKDVQKAIDNTFIAQQEKVVNAAKLDAQNDANERLVSEATAQAKARKEQAMGEAEAVRAKAKGEADAIKAIADASKEAQQTPLFLELKKLDVTLAWISRWGGNVNQFYAGSDGNTMPPMLFQLPMNDSAKK